MVGVPGPLWNGPPSSDPPVVFGGLYHDTNTTQRFQRTDTWYVPLSFARGGGWGWKLRG